MEDNEIAKLVNELTKIAVKYAGTDQLREHISRRIKHALELELKRMTDIMLDIMAISACDDHSQKIKVMSLLDFNVLHKEMGCVFCNYEKLNKDPLHLDQG